MSNDQPLSSLTKHNRDLERAKRRGEQEELIDALGDESEEKSVRAVQEYVKQLDDTERRKFQEDIERLLLLARHKKRYARYLSKVLIRFLDEEDIDPIFSINIDLTDMGIIVSIGKTSYHRAFKVSGMPFFDINACKVIAVQVGNTVAKLQGHVSRTDSGIILPDAEDKARYGPNGQGTG